MLLIFCAVAFVGLLGIIVVGTFCVAAARADEVMKRELSLDEQSGGVLRWRSRSTSTSSRPAA